MGVPFPLSQRSRRKVCPACPSHEHRRLCEVRARRPVGPHFAESTAPPTGTASTGCCRSWTSTRSRRRCRSQEAAEGDEVTVLTVGPEQAAETRAQGAVDGRRQGRPRQRRRPARLGRARPPRWCWPRRSRRRHRVDLVLPAWRPPTARMSVVPAMLAERLGVPQVTFASRGHRRRRHGDDPPRRPTTATQTVEASPAGRGQRRRTRSASRATRRSRGSWRRRRSRCETLGLADLGVDAERGRSRRRLDGGRVRRRRGRRAQAGARSSRTRATGGASSPSSSRRRSSSEPTAPQGSPMAEVLVLVDHVDGGSASPPWSC